MAYIATSIVNRQEKALGYIHVTLKSFLALTTNQKRRKMENDCINLYDNRLCYLTFHEYERNIVGYACAYPHNCKECKDYKTKNKKHNGNK